MSPLSTGFTEKVLSKLDKLDHRRVSRFVRGVVQERNFHGAVFDALTEGVVVTDPEGRVVMINRTARRMIGLSARAKVLGRPLIDLVGDDSLNTLLRRWEGEGVDQAEIDVELPEERALLVTLRTVDDEESGEAMARVAILADVTEHRRRGREADRARRLSSLAVLTAGVAHEIKNPLNSMRIHGQLLQQSLESAKWASEEQGRRSARSTEIILEETQRLARIVEQFMQAVRPVDPSPARHSLNAIIRRVLEAESPDRADPAVEVSLELDPQLPDVLVDDQQMAQVFLNLIRNAMESFDKPARRLSITSRAEGGAVMVTVADNGCGIAREDLERIYEPYFTTKFNGTGLGLMVVHRIVGEHSGRLVLKSREGEGTEVTVILPVDLRAPRLLTQQSDAGEA